MHNVCKRGSVCYRVGKEVGGLTKFCNRSCNLRESIITMRNHGEEQKIEAPEKLLC